MEWVDMSTAPSVIDWVSLLGVLGTGWAALAARSKAKAVQDSISSTTAQIVTAHLRQAIDEINRLSDMLHQAVKEDDPRGARYILVWLSRECGRSSTLISESKIQDLSRSSGAETITELLDRVASGASRAKGKLVNNETKLDSATKPVLRDLGELERDLVHVSTIIGYGMEEGNVHVG